MLNVVDVETGHICEIQLTLRGFMAAKSTGGHAMYKILRLVGRLEPASAEHQGDAGHEGNISRLADGLFSSWDGSGSLLTVESAGSRLAPALSSDRCFLQRLVINAVAGLPSLADTLLTEPVLAQLAPSLEVLEATHCNAAGPIPPGLQRCRRLMSLRLEFNKLDDHIPLWLGDLPRLKVLNLGSNMLRGRIPPELFRQGQLVELFLYENKLKKGLPAEVARCKRLVKIDVGFNYLGTLADECGELVELELFMAYRAQLTGLMPPWIRQLRNLTVLSISGNALSGPIPRWIGELTALRMLRLNHNEFSGEIPPELCNLVQLTLLKLNRNQLTGAVPPSFAQLTQLEVLNLAENKIDGDVPQSVRAHCADITL